MKTQDNVTMDRPTRKIQVYHLSYSQRIYHTPLLPYCLYLKEQLLRNHIL